MSDQVAVPVRVAVIAALRGHQHHPVPFGDRRREYGRARLARLASHRVQFDNRHPEGRAQHLAAGEMDDGPVKLAHGLQADIGQVLLQVHAATLEHDGHPAQPRKTHPEPTDRARAPLSRSPRPSTSNRRPDRGTHKGHWRQEGVGHLPGGFAWVSPGWCCPCVAGGVVSQAPIRRRTSARAAVALVSSPGAPGLNRGGSEQRCQLCGRPGSGACGLALGRFARTARGIRAGGP